jgi:acyl dehydratase
MTHTDDLAIGPLETQRVDGPLTITDFVRYQGASGDMNPIHHDPAFAQRAGFPGPFAVGMRQAGLLATYATDIFGAENIRTFRVQFRTIAWPGDTITYSGEVVAIRDEGRGSACDLELRATRDNGEVHLFGWASFALPD